MRMKTRFGAVVVALAGLYVLGCGNSSSPTMPTPGTGGGGGGGVGANVPVSINGISGSQSFSPNPASVSTGQTVGFVNNDPTNTHHIVADNGAFDTGTLAPGASSSAITLSSGTAVSYHCTIHPSMVGTINGSPSGGGGGGGY